MNGPTGLRDERIHSLFDMHQIKKSNRRRIFADLMVMEPAALDAMYAK